MLYAVAYDDLDPRDTLFRGKSYTQNSSQVKFLLQYIIFTIYRIK